jgi:hypothetical protein
VEKGVADKYSGLRSAYIKKYQSVPEPEESNETTPFLDV